MAVLRQCQPRGAAVSNGPITYELDVLQYVITGAGGRIVAFVLHQ